MITAFDLGDVFCWDPSLGFGSETVSLKQWQAKLFWGDLIADSYSAVSFFLSPFSWRVLPLNDTALWSGLYHPTALLTCLLFFSFTILCRSVSLSVWFLYLFSLSYRASRSLGVCVFLGLPLSPGTDRGRMTAREDQPRRTSASGAALPQRGHALMEAHLDLWLDQMAGNPAHFPSHHLAAVHAPIPPSHASSVLFSRCSQ